ncbi:hypothetical protein ACVSMR_05660 [Pseudomonas aeruginosa]
MNNIASLIERLGTNEGAQVTELARLYRQAEEKIKLVENLSQELSIPAVNELRYAGYHMVQYLSGDGEPEVELKKAQNHCKRAIYDAVEAGITHQLEMIRIFQQDFKVLILSDFIPNYPALQKQIREARDLILAPKNAHKDRAAYYEQCVTHLENLRAGLDKLDEHREELLKRLKQRNRSSIANWSMLAATLVATVIGAIFAALAYLKPPVATTPSPAGASAVASSTQQPPKPK